VSTGLNPGLVIVHLEFWHFDCSASETAKRISPCLFRSATSVRDWSVSSRSFSSVAHSGPADASQCGRIFSGTVSSLRALREFWRCAGNQLSAAC